MPLILSLFQCYGGESRQNNLRTQYTTASRISTSQLFWAWMSEHGGRACWLKDLIPFNRPQEPTQSNLSPAEGAAMWIKYLEPLKAEKKEIRLGSPAPSGASDSEGWLRNFTRECNGNCTLDFIALRTWNEWFHFNTDYFSQTGTIRTPPLSKSISPFSMKSSIFRFG